MNSSDFVAIICWILLQGGFCSLASGSRVIDLDEMACIVEQCNEYCVLNTTPCPDHLSELKVATDANNELKEKIHRLEVANGNLQSQLLNRATEIKDLGKQMEHITHLLEHHVKRMSEVLAEKNDHLCNINATAENLYETCLNGIENSIFLIKVKGMDKPFQVRCDSGWTIIQSRIDGSVNFNRNWSDYKAGFGDMCGGEFFIGLDKLHLITAAQPQELYIELRDVNGTERYARYDNFTVGSEAEGFTLKSLGKYSGNAGDSLRAHERGMFATLDRDSNSSCVQRFDGPWWFRETCGRSSLNGKYSKNGRAAKQNGISWGHWHNFDYNKSLIFVRIRIRPRILGI